MKLALAAASFLAASASALAAPADSGRIEQEFRAAMIASQAGNYGSAAATYRHLLQEAPTPRIKLELARTLYLSGRYSDSLTLFKEVYLDPATPQAVKRNILPYMEGAELRVVRIRYGVQAVTDSNPSKVGEGGTIYFNGVPLEYDPPEAKKVAYGIEPWLSAEKLWANGYLTKFYGSARLFEDDDLNVARLRFAVAKEVSTVSGLFVQAAVDAEANGYGGSYVLPTFEAWKRFKLSDTAGLGVGGQAGYMFVENEDVSGGYYRPYVFGDWTFLPNATAFAAVSVEHLNSRNDYYTYYAPKVSAGIDLQTLGFDIVPQLTVTKTRFTEYDPFWGLKREETTWRPQLTVSHDVFEWGGIRPEASVFFETRNSNVVIYDYSQWGGYVNFRKLF